MRGRRVVLRAVSQESRKGTPPGLHGQARGSRDESKRRETAREANTNEVARVRRKSRRVNGLLEPTLVVQASRPMARTFFVQSGQMMTLSREFEWIGSSGRLLAARDSARSPATQSPIFAIRLVEF